MWKNSGLIICPLPESSPEGVALMREVAEYIGVTRLTVSSAEQHDAVIAYTSDLMHIASAGLCIGLPSNMTPVFTGGAFRDCTRVADINAGAWTELLLDNRAHTLERLDEYIGNLEKMRGALAANDKKCLHALLERAGENKRSFLP
jgi:prephenate dehydrogenase